MQRRSILKTLGLAAAAQFTRQPPRTRPDIRKFRYSGRILRQVGYRPSDAKVATIGGAIATQNNFRLRDAADNRVVFEGPLTSPQTDEASGDLVQRAVFTSFRRPGTYRIEFGAQSTFAVDVSDHVYAEALRTTMRGYTGQRCGCEVDLGNGYTHPSCDPNGAYGASSGKSGTLPNQGGWHDAGDYGRYVVNSGITCGTLLWAWEMYPQALHDLRLGISKHHGVLGLSRRSPLEPELDAAAPGA